MLQDVQRKHQEEKADNEKVDIAWYDGQLYTVLSLVCQGDALTTVRQVRDQGGCRGSKAWYQLTREVAGKTGTRLLKLSDKAHNPRAISNYKEARGILNNWDEDVKEYEKCVGQKMAFLKNQNDIFAEHATHWPPPRYREGRSSS